MSHLTEIYQTLKAEGFCTTQADFSQTWLGRSPHYFAQIKGSAGNASLTSLSLLASRLEFAAFLAGKLATYESYRRIRSAANAAKVLCQGEYELRYVPTWYRTTAIDLN